jgi:predicted dehydrogenase
MLEMTSLTESLRPRTSFESLDSSDVKLGVAVLGCGYWGVNHVRVFGEASRSRVVTACDTRQERLVELAGRYPDVKLATSVDVVLRDPDVDAVIICTDASSHYPLARACLLAGKHVLVEKPLTTASEESRALIELADSSGLTLMVGHTFLHNPGVRKVKEYIDERELGHVYYLYARRTNLGPIRSDVNALWDLAPHDISIFNYFLDSTPEWVSAVGARFLNGKEDVGFVSLGYPGGVIGHVHVSWAEPNKVREVVVVGSESRVVFNDLDNLERVRVFKKGVASPDDESQLLDAHTLIMRDGDIFSPKVDSAEPLKIQCEHFLDCVQEGLPPLTGGEQGMAVVEVMEAIDRSMAQNGVPVSVR